MLCKESYGGKKGICLSAPRAAQFRSGVLEDVAAGNLLSQDSRTHLVMGDATPAPLPSLTLHPA